MIGVLNLQGGVVEHLDHLKRLGIACLPVKEKNDFQNLAGLIIPGGESTCMSRLIRIFGIEEYIKQEFRRGMKIWGTCAGAILLARSVVGESAHFNLIDIEVKRNSFGSQLESFTCEAFVPRVASQPIPLTFIRAPDLKALTIFHKSATVAIIAPHHTAKSLISHFEKTIFNLLPFEMMRSINL